MTDTHARSSPAATLMWAIFLAVSWTWCIGMFLPVLLVRDLGVWGFVAFAVPNVLGAAAMGWVIRSRESSIGMIGRHDFLVRLFSAVTIAFHLWFVWYLSQAGWVAGAWWPWMAVGIFSIALLSGLKAEKPWETLTPYLISVVVIAFSLWNGLEIKFAPGDGRRFLGLPASAWVAPVCFFGFLLCPYLDATFHRARRNLSLRGARVAFSLGFGVFFLVMILFTLAYSSLLLGDGVAGPRVLTAIVLHMLIQSGFTCGLHIRELANDFGGLDRVRLRGTTVSAGVIALLCGASVLLRFPATSNISPGFELGYRVFLSAYGLLFPAYVWLVVLPLRGTGATPGPRHMCVWLGACVLAAPAFWMGFIQKQEWWLVPGVIVPLAARILIPRGGAPRQMLPAPSVPSIPPNPTTAPSA